jgi:hypothetical protein
MTALTTHLRAALHRGETPPALTNLSDLLKRELAAV